MLERSLKGTGTHCEQGGATKSSHPVERREQLRRPRAVGVKLNLSAVSTGPGCEDSTAPHPNKRKQRVD